MTHGKPAAKLHELANKIRDLRDVAEGADLSKSFLDALARFVSIFEREQYQLKIDSVTPAYYNQYLSGWLQSLPTSAEKVYVSFSLRNQSSAPVSGNVYAYLDGGRMLEAINHVRGETSSSVIADLAPGATAIGSFSAPLPLEGAHKLRFIFVTAAPSRLPGVKVQRTVASVEQPFLVGERLNLAAMLNQALGITATIDPITGFASLIEGTASGVTRRLYCSTPYQSNGRGNSTAGSGLRYTELHDGQELTFLSGDFRISIENGAWQANYSWAVCPSGAADINTQPQVGTESAFFTLQLAPLPTDEVQISGSYTHFPSTTPMPNAPHSWDRSSGYSATWNPTTGAYVGDDISLQQFFGPQLDQMSFFDTAFVGNQALLQSQVVMLASVSPTVANMEGGYYYLEPPASSVPQPPPTLTDAQKVAYASAFAIAVRAVCSYANVQKINLWGWAVCIAAVVVGAAAAVTLSNASKTPASKGGGGGSGGGDQPNPAPSPGTPTSPTPFPANAECLIDQDCPPGYVCLNGVCVPVYGDY